VRDIGWDSVHQLGGADPEEVSGPDPTPGHNDSAQPLPSLHLSMYRRGANAPTSRSIAGAVTTIAIWPRRYAYVATDLRRYRETKTQYCQHLSFFLGSLINPDLKHNQT
jgi:hypothetical protein